MDIHLKETIPKVFQPIHKAMQNKGIQEVVAKGGRGSGKSSYLSLELAAAPPGLPCGGASQSGRHAAQQRV